MTLTSDHRPKQLPSHFNVNILKVTPLSRNRFTGKCLELYHGPRVDFPSDMDKTINSIKNNGFYMNQYGTNKGRGVYLSSSARYQYAWLGYGNPIMICDVLYTEDKSNKVKRFRSEVPPGYEYVVSDPKLIIPKYLVKYKVDGPFKELLINGNTIYTPHGQFGCKVFDPETRRCDCELEPTF